MSSSPSAPENRISIRHSTSRKRPRAMAAGKTKYTALNGTPELKVAIAAKFRRDDGLEYSPPRSPFQQVPSRSSMTVREIQGHLEELYGIEVSRP